jgi:hypothetical protein
MTAAVFAIFDETGTVVRTATDPAQPPHGTMAVDVTATNPQPTVGWTTLDHGQTWVAPTASSPLANQQILMSRAATALAANQTYLAIPTPTQAQAVTQVTALTQQINALIRLATNQLNATT